jgi:hypothetical protein
MTVIDIELRRQEHEWILSQLASAGVVITEIEDLREKKHQSVVSEEVLLACLPSLKESAMISSLIIALGCHDCSLETIQAVIEYFKSLDIASRDLWLQLWHLRELKADNTPPRPSAESIAEAKRVVEHEWYLSYEPPQREPVRVYDDDFPTPAERSSVKNVDVATAIGNFLLWQAKKTLFDDIADLLLDRKHGRGRSLLPQALRKCDSKRAPEVLMRMLNDPDVGVEAMAELGKLRCKEAWPLIEKFQDHPSATVQRKAKKALQQIKKVKGGRGSQAAISFSKVIPEDSEGPLDISGDVSGYVLGSMAEEEEGWTGQLRTIELDYLSEIFSQLGKAFDGDFAGSRGEALSNEILVSEPDDWEAYVLQVRLGSDVEKIWFHYLVQDELSVDITMWGGQKFLDRLSETIPLDQEVDEN